MKELIFLNHRWLMDCMRQEKIIEMPVEIEEWKDLNDENSMFSPSVVEKSITPWLEYPLGVVPKSEQQLHAST